MAEAAQVRQSRLRVPRQPVLRPQAQPHHRRDQRPARHHLAAFDRMGLTARDLTMDYEMVIRTLKLNIPIIELPTAQGQRIAGTPTSRASPPASPSCDCCFVNLLPVWP